MEPEILGLHHVTAIASDPQRNLDFYTQLLGLRLVKLTVNFDDPGTYHFYFGDGAGSPGTILTFFPWPGAPRGRRGTGQATVTAFSVPEGALAYWIDRLASHNVPVEARVRRFDEEALTFFDPDGLQLELVAHAGATERSGWTDGPVPPEQSLRGFYGVTLWEEGYERTAALLTETLGFRLAREESNLFRYEVGPGGAGTHVDVRCLPDAQSGLVAAGTVHHIAWRTPNDEQQRAWRQKIAGLRYNVSPIMDRQYFHSIYFREPGGVLFEIATDPPGFAIDEPLDQLGTHLMLPPEYEAQRAQIERVVPPLRLPGAGR